MAKNLYVGEYPAIGIRPIIDGRSGRDEAPRKPRGVRLWTMAEAAEKLFEENLRYSNGEPVKSRYRRLLLSAACPKSAACAEKFRREGVAVTLSVTPCWCYGSETMDMDR